MGSTTVKAIIIAVVANALTLAIVFGVHISSEQQDAILAFVGSVTTAAAALVAWIETHHIKAKAAVDAASVSAPAPAPAK